MLVMPLACRELGKSSERLGHAGMLGSQDAFKERQGLLIDRLGLGILAGDHLKSASDLGVPLIGVGLLYRHGYFTQSLSAEGWQTERYPAATRTGCR